jgi:hypothetical protein
MLLTVNSDRIFCIDTANNYPSAAGIAEMEFALILLRLAAGAAASSNQEFPRSLALTGYQVRKRIG